MAEITYLMDSDPGATGYFHEASGYFSARSGNTVVAAPAGRARTLEEVFTDLRTRADGRPGVRRDQPGQPRDRVLLAAVPDQRRPP